MNPSAAQLERLGFELDQNHLEIVVLPWHESAMGFTNHDLIGTPAPQMCLRNHNTVDSTWDRAKAAYDASLHRFFNTSWGTPSVLGVNDAYNFSRFFRDIGGIHTKSRISTYNGKQYIVLSGYAGLRNKLKGTRYGIHNPQLVEVGIGKYGIRGTSISGFKVSCYLAVGVEVLEWIFDDEAVMTDLFAGAGVEFVKAGIASAAGYMFALSLGRYVTRVIFPVAVAAGIAFAVSVVLNIADNDKKIKTSIKRGIRYISDNWKDLPERLEILVDADFIELINEEIRAVKNNITGEINNWATRNIERKVPLLPNWAAPLDIPHN